MNASLAEKYDSSFEKRCDDVARYGSGHGGLYVQSRGPDGVQYTDDPTQIETSTRRSSIASMAWDTLSTALTRIGRLIGIIPAPLSERFRCSVHSTAAVDAGRKVTLDGALIDSYTDVNLADQTSANGAFIRNNARLDTGRSASIKNLYVGHHAQVGIGANSTADHASFRPYSVCSIGQRAGAKRSRIGRFNMVDVEHDGDMSDIQTGSFSLVSVGEHASLAGTTVEAGTYVRAEPGAYAAPGCHFKGGGNILLKAGARLGSRAMINCRPGDLVILSENTDYGDCNIEGSYLPAATDAAHSANVRAINRWTAGSLHDASSQLSGPELFCARSRDAIRRLAIETPGASDDLKRSTPRSDTVTVTRGDTHDGTLLSPGQIEYPDGRFVYAHEL